jgi:hypothetical protein
MLELYIKFSFYRIPWTRHAAPKETGAGEQRVTITKLI